jgi:hypothetical protein
MSTTGEKKNEEAREKTLQSGFHLIPSEPILI